MHWMTWTSTVFDSSLKSTHWVPLCYGSPARVFVSRLQSRHCLQSHGLSRRQYIGESLWLPNVKVRGEYGGKSLSADLRPDGIAVRILHPGYVKTGMTGFRGNWGPEEAAPGFGSTDG